jgi:hypothetical protein
MVLALALAALCPGVRTSHAQAAPMQYWSPNWLGFGGTVDQSPGADGNLAGFDGNGASRYNFPNGMFIGSTRNSMSGFGQLGAFGNFGALSSEGVQFGYNFKNTPVSVYAGFDTLKYNSGPGPGSPFAPFDSAAGNLSGGYTARAGVEIRPTSNLSLSVGVGVFQQPSGVVDSDINSPFLPGATPFAVRRR